MLEGFRPVIEVLAELMRLNTWKGCQQWCYKLTWLLVMERNSRRGKDSTRMLKWKSDARRVWSMRWIGKSFTGRLAGRSRPRVYKEELTIRLRLNGIDPNSFILGERKADTDGWNRQPTRDICYLRSYSTNIFNGIHTKRAYVCPCKYLFARFYVRHLRQLVRFAISHL